MGFSAPSPTPATALYLNSAFGQYGTGVNRNVATAYSGAGTWGAASSLGSIGGATACWHVWRTGLLTDTSPNTGQVESFRFPTYAFGWYGYYYGSDTGDGSADDGMIYPYISMGYFASNDVTQAYTEVYYGPMDGVNRYVPEPVPPGSHIYVAAFPGPGGRDGQFQFNIYGRPSQIAAQPLYVTTTQGVPVSADVVVTGDPGSKYGSVYRSAVSGGTVVFDPDSLHFTYTPPAGRFLLGDYFVYKATDAWGNTSTNNVQVSIGYTAPPPNPPPPPTSSRRVSLQHVRYHGE